jgi:hypothetical protein
MSCTQKLGNIIYKDHDKDHCLDKDQYKDHCQDKDQDKDQYKDHDELSNNSMDTNADSKDDMNADSKDDTYDENYCEHIADCTISYMVPHLNLSIVLPQ